MACIACGFEVSLEFAFCPKCGNRLNAPSADVATPVAAQVFTPPASEAGPQDKEADRRPVTVLFADLSGFTTLSERLDPEDVRALQSDLFKELSETSARFDGFVEKDIGDAVLAVFGAPAAHEDDPERAVRAALSMIEKVAALSDNWIGRLQQPLTLHVGINTGPVVAG